jgi:hypothetical protein
MIETNVFFKDIKNKSFAFLPINNDNKYISFQM